MRIDKAPVPMAFRDLVDGYIMEARSSAETDAGRLAALEQERSRLWCEVKGGDWESMATSFAGSSSSFRRGITATERHRACLRAIEILSTDPTATRMKAGIVTPFYPDEIRP